MNLLSTWVFGVMLAISPSTKFKQHFESEEAMKVRYEQTANDMVDAIRSSKPLFTGDNAELQEAALLTSIAFFESGFRKDVDNGTVRGDNGGSWCLMQLNIGGGNVKVGTEEMKKWNGKDLIKDRKKCFKAAIEVLRLSMKECSQYNGSDVISLYTSGKCAPGEPLAKSRWNFAGSLVKKYPFENSLPLQASDKK